jgi:hypothetical protein
LASTSSFCLLGLIFAADDGVEGLFQLVGRRLEVVGHRLELEPQFLDLAQCVLLLFFLEPLLLVLGFSCRVSDSISRCTRWTPSTASFMSSISRRFTDSVNSMRRM